MRPLLYSIIIFFLAVSMGSCSGERSPDQERDSAMEHKAHSQMQIEAGEASGHSIYNVSSIWLNRHGKKVSLDELRGKIQVVAMLYTHCEFACPRILADMRRISGSLSDEALRATNFTIISIDPERDTPERLREFARENKLSEEHWTLLSGNNGDVLEMAALLGVKYKRISDTDFAHSNILSVLNRQGEIVHQQMKLGDQLKQTVRTIENLAQ